LARRGLALLPREQHDDLRAALQDGVDATGARLAKIERRRLRKRLLSPDLASSVVTWVGVAFLLLYIAFRPDIVTDIVQGAVGAWLVSVVVVAAVVVLVHVVSSVISRARESEASTAAGAKAQPQEPSEPGPTGLAGPSGT